MNYAVYLLLLFALFQSCTSNPEEEILYESDAFTIYPNKVVQGNNVADILSSTHIKSNYKSPASANFSRLVVFKVSINEKDNELPSGQDHWVVIGDESTAPTIVFGEKPEPIPASPNTFLPANYTYTFKVDVSPVLKQFEEKGFYEAFDGSKIAKSDFKGFFLAGGSEPLSWDFVNLDNKGLKLQPTDDPNIYSITLKLNPFDENESSEKEWKQTKDLSNRPKYTSDQPIVDALFNMSLEETIQNIEADSTFRTGAKWAGVWTRDVSYSTILAFAYHEPEVAKISLRKKVKRNRIIQDTGSGGAWPVSSDRTTWVLAAWEIYKVTGDENWLNEIYPIIKNTLDDDFKTLYDPNTGMFCGESSFLDWREQTYPKWMSNMDIYVSQNLGTNVVHYQAHKILAEISNLKNEDGSVYSERAENIKTGINKFLWQQEKGYYAQFLYGKSDLIASPRFEALGAGLAVLYDVADDKKASEMISKAPLTAYGTTCIYPQIPGIPPYHNNGIWPFVQAYWNLAAAKTGNEAALNHGLASIYRAGALFLTNYENFVAETGDFEGTEINSYSMLWSMAGNLAMVHRVFMGMHFETDGIHFKPVVPKAYGGTKELSNFKYRDAIINIKIKGYGNEIKTVRLNGEKIDQAFIPANLSGNQTLEIELNNKPLKGQEINLQANRFSLSTPQVSLNNNQLRWEKLAGAKSYNIYRFGERLQNITQNNFNIEDEVYAIYAVSAIDENGYESFISEPMSVNEAPQVFELEQFANKSNLPYSNFSGIGFVEISLEKNSTIQFKIQVEQAGTYLLDFRYANGSGPWNTDNKCAIRSLNVNGDYQGAMVFPQRGQNEWSDWGFSNARKVKIQKGENIISLSFEDWNHNMNGEINTAMLDYLRLIKLAE